MQINLVPNREHLRRMREIGQGIGARMDDPALLRSLGATHRKQETQIFNTEGAAGRKGLWAGLNARYAARKRKVVGRKKILQLTGETKRRFTVKSEPGYYEQYVPRGTLGIFQFGARSNIAAAHLHGNPALAPHQSALARRVFGGRAPRLAVRDMVTKSEAQLVELRKTFTTWYVSRVRQYLRGRARLAGIR